MKLFTTIFPSLFSLKFINSAPIIENIVNGINNSGIKDSIGDINDVADFFPGDWRKWGENLGESWKSVGENQRKKWEQWSLDQADNWQQVGQDIAESWGKFAKGESVEIFEQLMFITIDKIFTELIQTNATFYQTVSDNFGIQLNNAFGKDGKKDTENAMSDENKETFLESIDYAKYDGPSKEKFSAAKYEKAAFVSLANDQKITHSKTDLASLDMGDIDDSDFEANEVNCKFLYVSASMVNYESGHNDEELKKFNQDAARFLGDKCLDHNLVDDENSDAAYNLYNLRNGYVGNNGENSTTKSSAQFLATGLVTYLVTILFW